MTDREKWLVRFGSGWVTYLEFMDAPDFYNVYLTLKNRAELVDDLTMERIRLRDL